MATDIRNARKYLQQGDISALSKELEVSQQHIHAVINGRSPKLEIKLAVLRLADQRKREAQEIEQLNKSLSA